MKTGSVWRSLQRMSFVGLVVFNWINSELLALPVPQHPIEVSATESFSGTVIERRKYSVVVSNGRETRQIYLPEQLPVDLIVDRPRIQLAEKQLIQEQIFGNNRGDGIHRHVFPLPEVLSIEVVFAHANEQQRVMQDPLKRIGRYRLFPGAVQNDLRTPFDWVSGSIDNVALDRNSSLTMRGQIVDSSNDGRVTIKTDEQQFEAELGNRDAVLSGFSIVDLRPFETVLRTQLVKENDKWIAQRVSFRRIVDPKQLDQPELPRVLILGDEVSISYQRTLLEKYGPEFNFHRPPENCRGSENFSRLDEWLGPWDLTDRNWDVIVFNCGLADLETSRDSYCENLEFWIEKLQATGAKLVWVTTTPVPSGYISNGRVENPAAKIGELNQWAAELIDANQTIVVCDLNQFVVQQKQPMFVNWRKGKQVTFNLNQAQHLAEHVANTIRQTLEKRP